MTDYLIPEASKPSFESPGRDPRIPGSNHISGNYVIIEIGNVPIGMLRNLSLSEQVDEEEITEIGNPLVEDFAPGIIRANISGSLTLSSKMPIFKSGFLPGNPLSHFAKALTRKYFDIHIYPRKAIIQADGSVKFEKMSNPMFSVNRCRYAGSSIDIPANKPIVSNFQAKAQMIEKNFTSFQMIVDETA